MTAAKVIDLPVPAEFNLSTVVREALDASLDPDPLVVAGQIADDIPDSLLREALRQALRVFVSQASTKVRHRRVRSALRQSDGEGISPRWVDAAGLYAKMLMVREPLGDGKYKFLGDMTRDEVLCTSEARIKDGKASIVAGRRYALIAEAMQTRKAAVVGDLPQEVLMGVFQ